MPDLHELGQPEPVIDWEINRRDFLLGSTLLLSGLAVVSCESTTTQHRLELSEREYPIHRAPLEKETKLPLDQIDTTYLGDVFERLAESRASAEKHLQYVRNALHTVRLGGGNEPDIDIGTALQIDESGIYLTASHVALYSKSEALAQFVLAVSDPSSGAVNSVAGAIKHTKADVAVLYAPTGKTQKATEGLAIDTTTLRDHQQLLLIGLYPYKNRLYGMEHTGVVDRSVDLGDNPHPEKYFPSYRWERAARIAVKGMIPYGGTSGGPILNEQGAVVGVESGHYPTTMTRVKDYVGARITPIAYAKSLPKQPPLLYGS